MTRYQMHLHYVTAVLLLTLSWCSQASQCNEQEWNKALISQQALDRKYNLLATRYNQWLPSFHQSIFLHKEFSQQELTYLWTKNSDNFHKKIDQQILAAIQSRQSVNELTQHINTIPPIVDIQIDTWQSMQDACHTDKHISNEVAANHYIDSNTTLKRDLTNLLQQLEIMRGFYDKEILILRNISASPH